MSLELVAERGLIFECTMSTSMEKCLYQLWLYNWSEEERLSWEVKDCPAFAKGHIDSLTKRWEF